MPRGTAPRSEARLHAPKRRSFRPRSQFWTMPAFQAPPLRTPRTPRDCVPSCTPSTSTAHPRILPPFAQTRGGLGILRTRLRGPAPVRADPPPGTGEHRTPRNLGECAPSHPRLCQASNHCENRYISRKTLTSAVIGHVCTFGSDDPRVFSDFNPLLRRPHLSTSMSASVSQLPNGKHSPLSHRNGTYYWQGE